MLGEFELEFLHLLEQIRINPLNIIFEYISKLGEGTLCVGIIALFYYVINKEYAVELTYLFSGSHVFNGLVKNFACVTRPFSVENNPVTCVYPDTATGYSFPSGHTQIASTLYPSLAQHYKKKILIIIASILVPIIGFSRMYLGCHYPSDVVFGIIFGLIWALLMSKVYEKVGKKKAFIFTIIFYAPFGIYFLFRNDPLFADFYKTYGMMVFGYFAIVLENKYVNFKTEGSLKRRILRFLIAGGVAVGLLLGVKVLFNLIPQDGWLTCLLAFIRYGILSFAMLGLMPIIFKKVGL